MAKELARKLLVDGFKQNSSQNFSILRKLKIQKKQSIQAFRTSKERCTKFFANLRKAGTKIKKKKMPLPSMAQVEALSGESVDPQLLMDGFKQDSSQNFSILRKSKSKIDWNGGATPTQNSVTTETTGSVHARGKRPCNGN